MQQSVIHYGVVLAGGRSSRMGQDKADLEIHGQSMLQRSENCLSSTYCQTVWISRNQQGFLRDRYPDGGPLSGIEAALTKILDESKHQVCFLTVMPVDLPLMTSELMTKLQDAAVSNNTACYFSSSNLPLVLPVKKELLTYCQQALKGVHSASIGGLLDYAQAIAVEATISDELTNTNTPEHWQQLLATELSIN